MQFLKQLNDYIVPNLGHNGTINADHLLQCGSENGFLFITFPGLGTGIFAFNSKEMIPIMTNITDKSKSVKVQYQIINEKLQIVVVVS